MMQPKTRKLGIRNRQIENLIINIAKHDKCNEKEWNEIKVSLKIKVDNMKMI